MFNLAEKARNYLRGRKGQGMVEYAMILAFVVIIAVAVTSGDISTGITKIFSSVGTKLSSTATSVGNAGAGAGSGE